MWAGVDEVCAPCRHQVACMAQAVEQMRVQAFVAHSAIETLDEPVLHRFAWCDVGQSTLRSSCRLRIAFDVSSVPLSDTTEHG